MVYHQSTIQAYAPKAGKVLAVEQSEIESLVVQLPAGTLEGKAADAILNNTRSSINYQTISVPYFRPTLTTPEYDTSETATPPHNHDYYHRNAWA